MKALTQTFLAGVAGALTVGVLIAAAGPLGLSDNGIQFPDGSVQTTAAAAFGLEDAANDAARISCTQNPPTDSYNAFLGCTAVPAGKILVVEHVSVEAIPTVGCEVGAHFGVYLPPPFEGLASMHFLTLENQFVFLGSADYLRGTTPLRAYLDEGEQPGAWFQRNCTESDWTVQLRVTGYYVDKVQP